MSLTTAIGNTYNASRLGVVFSIIMMLVYIVSMMIKHRSPEINYLIVISFIWIVFQFSTEINILSGRNHSIDYLLTIIIMCIFYILTSSILYVRATDEEGDKKLPHLVMIISSGVIMFISIIAMFFMNR
jgi:hypothetical protein